MNILEKTELEDLLHIWMRLLKDEETLETYPVETTPGEIEGKVSPLPSKISV